MEKSALVDLMNIDLGGGGQNSDILEANPQDNMDGDPGRRPQIQFQFWMRNMMVCPSSQDNTEVVFSRYNLENLRKSNYAACWTGRFASYNGAGGKVGTGAVAPSLQFAGIFGPVKVTKFPGLARLGYGKGTTITGIADGTSNTVLLSEVLPTSTSSDWRGATICPGMGANMFSTWTAPNSTTPDAIYACDPSNPERLPCVVTAQTDGNMFAAARSKHTGGVNAAFADGSVRFIRDSISLQNWNGMGTKSGGEVVNLD
jgi:prepilin-type processing-associated H-X9-DG protein